MALQLGDVDQVHHRAAWIAEAVDQLFQNVLARLARSDTGDLFVHFHAQQLVGNVFMRHISVHADFHARFDIALRSVAAQLAHGFLDHLHIQIVADGGHVSALLRAQQVAHATNLQIAHGYAEAGAKFRKFTNRAQALIRVLRHHLVGIDGEISVRQPVAAAHAAAQLIQLRKPEAVRVAHDERVGARHVQPCLNDRGA